MSPRLSAELGFKQLGPGDLHLLQISDDTVCCVS